MNNLDPSTTKYLIKARMRADGVVEKPDVVGAIFGQTEGLIGDELDLRDLQKSGRIGRIEVNLTSGKGRSEGEILVPSSLDQIETAILAAALETIDRVGPCKAKIEITTIEDVRAVKKAKIVERAKKLLAEIIETSKAGGIALTESVRQAVQVEEIISYGPDKCPAGPNIDSSDAIIVVEGRSDVLNLLKHGIKNAIAVEGTNIPQTIIELSRNKIVTAFVDGDRGGELILKELLQVTEVDFVTRAPPNQEVEELTSKQIMKALRNKMPAEQYIEMYGLTLPTQTFEEEQQQQQQQPVTVVATKTPTTATTTATKTSTMPQSQPQPSQQRKRRQPPPQDKQSIYKDRLKNLIGTRKAQLFDAKGEMLRELAVSDLVQALKKYGKNVTAIVFDGVITQRLLDAAAENDIRTVIGMRIGSIIKQPVNIQILSKSDLGI